MFPIAVINGAQKVIFYVLPLHKHMIRIMVRRAQKKKQKQYKRDTFQHQEQNQKALYVHNASITTKSRTRAAFLHFTPPGHGLGKCDFIGVFQIQSDRKPMGDSCYSNPQRLDQPGQIGGGSLAFNIGIRGENDL